ncbi:uncharacterized protein LOC132628524 [Lycium barbarum]|uniref:uncharacterized protein LOC132628524 n=1 Tax=Lycium barbarum TaxID=112863 RepID=UPI00293EF906|nr:uncharacterized protein LOC132628524 [Lycium barbarum]
MGKFEEGTGITPKQIQKEVSERFGCEISYWKAYQAGIIAKEFVRGSADDGYSKLIPYSWIVHRTNPESKTDLNLDEEGRFLYYFLAFEAWIRGFKHMRKVIAVDGTHLKRKYGGVLLTVVAQDVENHVFPVACCVVDYKCDASWNYFFQQLLDIVPNSLDFCIISDRHLSIKKAIRDVYTNAHHGVCTRHLCERMSGRFHNGSFEKFFYRAAKAYTSEVFYDHFSEIQRVATNVADCLRDEVGFDKWSRAFFRGNRFEVLTSNIAESFNSMFLVEREFPITDLFNAINTRFATKFNERRTFAKNLLKCAMPRSETRIKENGSEVIDVEKLPCPHAIAALSKRYPDTFGDSVYNHSSAYYSADTYYKVYEGDIVQIPHDTVKCIFVVGLLVYCPFVVYGCRDCISIALLFLYGYSVFIIVIGLFITVVGLW